MKTNQQLDINIGNWGTLSIWHSNGFTNLNDIVKVANKRALEKNPKHRNFTIAKVMRSVKLWEFIIELYNVDVIGVWRISTPSTKPQISEFKKCGESPHFNNRDYMNIEVPFYDSYQGDYLGDSDELSVSILDDYKDSKGRIEYSKLITMFPDLINSSFGKNPGTYADLRIALKISGMIDTRIEAEIYTLVVTNQLLIVRDDGGDSFNQLNDLIDTLEDRVIKNKDNKGCYIQTAKAINAKVNGAFDKGWNDAKKGYEQQKYRLKILDNLIYSIQMGFIKTYPQLKQAITKI